MASGGFIVLLTVLTIVSNRRLKRIIDHPRSRAKDNPADEVVQRVKRIVAEMRGMNPEDVFLDMTLEDDLGISGDDADDLFREFAKKFPEVDLCNLDLGRYFHSEGFAPWFDGRPRRALRIKDLVRAARDKRWQSP